MGGVANLAGPASPTSMGLQIGDYGTYTAMTGAVVVETQFREDGSHVSLYGALRKSEEFGERGIRVALGHQRKDGGFSLREGAQGCPGGSNERLYDGWIQGDAAGGNPAHGVVEVVQVEHAVLEEVAEARGADQLQAVPEFDVLREQEHADRRGRSRSPTQAASRPGDRRCQFAATAYCFHDLVAEDRRSAGRPPRRGTTQRNGTLPLASIALEVWSGRALTASAGGPTPPSVWAHPLASPQALTSTSGCVAVADRWRSAMMIDAAINQTGRSR